jgi:hypothetical protein
MFDHIVPVSGSLAVIFYDFLNECNILDLYEKRNTTWEILKSRERDRWMDGCHNV